MDRRAALAGVALATALLTQTASVRAIPALECSIEGTSGPDRLVGTGDGDIICAGAGDDVILGRAGNDWIIAHGGADTVRGGPGQDKIDGMSGADVVRGGGGADQIDGGRHADRLLGQDGRDTIAGDRGRDRVWGGDADDRCLDVSDGRPGEAVFGGSGSDLYNAEPRDRVVNAEIETGCTLPPPPP